MDSIKSLLASSTRQRQLSKQLEAIRGRLRRMAYAWSHNIDVADEIVQKTITNALDNGDDIRNADAMDIWLFRSLSNCFAEFCRQCPEAADVDKILACKKGASNTVHGQNEMLASIRYAIARLPLKHRQVITFVDIEGFSYAKVADILDVPMGTIMSRLNRARQSLKKGLAESKIKSKQTGLKVVQ